MDYLYFGLRFPYSVKIVKNEDGYTVITEHKSATIKRGTYFNQIADEDL